MLALEGFQYPDAGNVLLYKCAQTGLLALHGFALPVDSGTHKVDAHGHQRQRHQRKKGQFPIDVNHDNDHQKDEHG